VSQGIPDAGLDTAIIQVTPESAPDASETKDLVQSIRDLAPAIEAEFGTPISVTGTTAVGIDISNRLTDALVPFGLIVVGLSIILLMMVFRSVLVPIKAAVGFLLSVVASFGVVVAIFQWGWLSEILGVENPGPIISFLPILLMAVLFGLAMDYEVFLVSGMREEYVATGNARFAVERGFGNGARVVTAAALIMFFVFFAFVPEGTGAIQPIALGLAVGIAFDAFLVRMTLVPAVMTLLGRSAWWLPKRLGRALPNMDIEGESLREHREAGAWASTQAGAALSADFLVAGSSDNRVGPLSFTAPPGSLILLGGAATDRALVAATLAGRLQPLEGRAQVGGHPLPTDGAAVSRLVAIADVGRTERTGTPVSFGTLLGERLRLTQPWYRSPSRRRQADRVIERIGRTLSETSVRQAAAIRADTIVGHLPPLERAVAIAAVAIAERTPVVMLDLDAFAGSDDGRIFLETLWRLAPESTTIFVGSPEARVLAEYFAPVGRDVLYLEIPPAPAMNPERTQAPGGAP